MRRRYGARHDPPEVARRRMVYQHLRGRGIADERVLEAMTERAARAVRASPGCGSGPTRTRRCRSAHGQTISQPYIVARICEALALRGTERVLDVGTGSGYQAAVLSRLAAEVHTIERVPELAEGARSALAEAGYTDVHVHVGDGTLGLPAHAPFGAIAVAAAAPEIPQALYEQLEPRGRLVVPVGKLGRQELLAVIRSPEGPAVIRSVPCRFVPLIGAEGFPVE